MFWKSKKIGPSGLGPRGAEGGTFTQQSSGRRRRNIVDDDDRQRELKLATLFVGWLIESLPFRMIMLGVIILNSISIGIQTDRYLEENYGSIFLALDRVFLALYVMEILVKWYHDFVGFWRSGWNVFDFVIVAASLLGPSLTFFSSSRVLRVLRVLRALRSLRSISVLRGLQIVVHTILHSIPDMANIVALLLICMFIFAIMGFSLFSDKCPEHFGSLGTTMFSLFICVTQDGWMSITRELNTPTCNNYILGAIYLLVFITIGAFIFANLVVAVVVTNLEWAIAEQREIEQKQKHQKPQTESQKIVTIDATDTLHKMAGHQEPMMVPDLDPDIEQLENYFLVLSAIEDNLADFKKLQEGLAEILHEVRALSSLDDISDDEVFGLSAMERTTHHPSTPSLPPAPEPAPQRRRFFSMVSQGDALSDLIAFNQAQRVNSQRAHSVHTLIHQLRSRTSSTHPHLHPHSSTHSTRITPRGSHVGSFLTPSPLPSHPGTANPSL